ncbi:MAG TPA: FUSC family protein [Noviherbaspirillum sp.]|jgi:uncharacterized membrane protein YccC|uniref:FUSC family protein n=1 Tax=Noviherbaspirillum sp. TaxID=1926288 RepID=UPI002F92D615
MSEQGWLRRLPALLREELRQLTTIHASDRAWQMPVAAALASGLPLLIGAWFDRLGQGLAASLGGLVFLYLPGTPLYHRMISLLACASGMTACYTLGLLSHFVPALMMPMLVFTSILATMVSRFYGLGPPGSLFFIMAAAIGAYTPVPPGTLPLMVGLLTMGCLLACLVGFLYSAYILRLHAPKPVPPLPAPTFDFVVFDSVVIGACVGISLAAAQLLQLEKPYWVPISCMAVIQGTSLRAVWNRQLQRVLGTAIGLLVAWGLLSLPLDKWRISLLMMSLTFIIESTVVRHYAFACIFITPLTILLAEAAVLGHGSPHALVTARFIDTLLGCMIGLLGGICLHSPRFRAALTPLIRRFVPPRLRA